MRKLPRQPFPCTSKRPPPRALPASLLRVRWPGQDRSRRPLAGSWHGSGTVPTQLGGVLRRGSSAPFWMFCTLMFFYSILEGQEAWQPSLGPTAV